MSCFGKNGAVGPDDTELDIMASQSCMSHNDRQTSNYRLRSARQQNENRHSDNNDNKPLNSHKLNWIIVINLIELLIIILLGVVIAVKYHTFDPITCSPCKSISNGPADVGHSTDTCGNHSAGENEIDSSEAGATTTDTSGDTIAGTATTRSVNSESDKDYVSGTTTAPLDISISNVGSTRAQSFNISAITTQMDTATARITVPGTSEPAATITGTSGTTNVGTSTTSGVDACDSQPCQNGGMCSKDGDGFRCDCPVCGCSQGRRTPTCGLADDLCVDQPQYIAHPYSCGLFVQCSNSAVGQVLLCQPAVNVFNPATSICAPLDDVTCAQQP